MSLVGLQQLPAHFSLCSELLERFLHLKMSDIFPAAGCLGELTGGHGKLKHHSTEVNSNSGIDLFSNAVLVQLGQLV